MGIPAISEAGAPSRGLRRRVTHANTSTEARVLVKSGGSGLCVCCSPLASGWRFFFFL